MKAIVCTKYGSPEVLQLKEIEKPAPKDDQILVKIHAASVNALDWHFLRGSPFLVRLQYGFLKPKNKILGYDIAGRVEAVGKNVTRFKPGDDIFGGLGFGLGGFAEYACMDEDKFVTQKPSSISFEEAAAVPAAAVTELIGLCDRGQIQSKQKVLINGAAGGVGTFSVQIAKSYGTEVTGVCSAQNLDMVHLIGADKVIDYTAEDFAQHRGQYDVVFDAVHKMPGDYRRLLKEGGAYLNVDSSSDRIRKNDIPHLLQELKELAEAGKVKAVIDRRYPLEQIVEAHRYVDTGRKKGNVVVTVTA